VEIDERGGGKLKTLLRALCMKQDADIVVADIIPLALLLSLRNRGRLLYFAQDYDESYYANSIQRFFIQAFYAVGLGLLKIPVIAVSSYLGEILRQRFGASVDVVTNGVDTNLFFHEPDPLLEKSKMGRRAIVVLARADYRKGFDIARVVIDLLAKGAHADSLLVWCVGDACPAAFGGIPFQDFGYVDERRLRQLFSSADLFLYPSRHEGYGLMPVEAMACGCPVVTTRAVKVVEHGKNALVSEVGDVKGLTDNITTLISSEPLRDKLVAGGLQFARENSLATAQEKFVRTLARLF
ncbi:MAG: glycosyltransferase, partial [Lentisphaerae bacterium]